MRRAAILAAALSLLVVPSAGADGGLTLTYTVISGTPGDNGWYRSAVNARISWGADVVGTTCPGFYNPTSNSAPALDCKAWDVNNATVTLSLKFKIDTDAPSVTGPGASRSPDANGWYNHAVAFAFTGSDATSGIASCTAVQYGGPDAASAGVTGTCRDVAGNVSAAATYPLKYDATPPTVSAASDRPPDANGWFNHPVAFAFPASDATSGIASCTAGSTYAGPFTGGATVSGTCSDSAGNSAGAALTFKYDASAPRLADLDVELGNGTATLSWKQPPDTSAVSVVRTPGRGSGGPSTVYDGKAPRFHDTGLKAGVAYRYTLSSRDEAGNRATANVTAKMRPLFAPDPGTVVRGRPHLAWMASPGATYYNVQLFRNGHKLLSAWPLGTSYVVPRHWTFDGKRVTLSRGLYRWYVWPGRGARARSVYGALLGSSTFRVR